MTQTITITISQSATPKTIYSVVVSHQAENHQNFLYTDKAKAVAKMEEIKASWKKVNGIIIHPYEHEQIHIDLFGYQYGTKVGFWYENENGGENHMAEYGSVDVIECTLE